ncbi:MAG TPA: hypothetical protein VGR81_12400 [Candidatus Acidoferrales bacterium]|nr:hypothetical protein [Candidatus Acidoferrales bacterium]
MNWRKMAGKLIAAGAAVAGILLGATSTFAQGCALCYNDAAASGPQAEAALRHGILILLIPPMVIFAFFYGMLYRRRNVHFGSEAKVSEASFERHNAGEIVLPLS